jgi:hypothetical protein
MKKLRRALLWIVALALPASLLMVLPSGAADPPAAETAPVPEAATSDELPPDERVSADNNLSFPVDI